jgi:type III secretory pathway lipoprotein EscJ
MIRKVVSLILVAVLLCGAFAGCGLVEEIADSVVAAAKQELENQIKAKLEEQKVDAVEMKTAFGKLNDEGGEYQFFGAVLVKTDSQMLPQAAADALAKLFTDAGLVAQTGSKVENAHLVHKDITYDHSDFTDGTYYTIYVYTSLSLDALKDLAK